MLLLLFCGVWLAWFLAGKLYRNYWNRNLTLQLSFRDAVLYEGDTSSIRETVINDKLLPLPAIEVRFAADRSLEFQNDARANSSASDQRYKRDVFSFLFHQKIERTLPFVPHRRGLYQITSASVTGYDFFFRSGYYMDVPQQTSLFVWPRQVDTRRITLLYQAVSGILLSKSRLYPDPFEFAGIREYQRSDPRNHINWKATARMGSLMTNQFDSTTDLALTVLLDLEDELILKYGELNEESIRIASSLAARFVKNRLAFTIKSNVTDLTTGTPFSMDLAADAGSPSALNQKLACIDTAQTSVSTAGLIAAEADAKRADHTYVLISKNKNTGLLKSLSALTGMGNQVLWILPLLSSEHSSPDDLPRTSAGITVLPWEVS